MSGNSSSARSARASKQLRDSKGRFIEMGSLVKWFDSVESKQHSGVVTDLLDDGRAVIDRTDRPGGFVARVKAHLLEVIDEKATLKTPEAKPAVPTKTVKESKSSHIDGFNVYVSENAISIEKPDGYGSGDSVYVPKNGLEKISKAISDGSSEKISLSSGLNATVTPKGIKIVSQSINPNDGMPGPYNSVTVPLASFEKMLEASNVELADKEIPDYSKMPKKTPEPVKKAEPYVPKKFVPAPRHQVYDGSSKIEITEKEVNIFTEDGYGTGDAAYLSKENFKKIAVAYDAADTVKIGGYEVSFKDGKIKLYSRYVNPNDGMPGPAKTVTINKKALDDVMAKIDVLLTASRWSETDIIAQELAIGSTLFSNNGITIKKVSEELWEYQANSNKISYNNRSIDCFKSIDSIAFNVETD